MTASGAGRRPHCHLFQVPKFQQAAWPGMVRPLALTPGPGFGLDFRHGQESCGILAPSVLDLGSGMGEGTSVKSSHITRAPGFPMPPSLLSWGLGWVGELSIWVKNHARPGSLWLIHRPGAGNREKLWTEVSSYHDRSGHPHPLSATEFWDGGPGPTWAHSQGLGGILGLEVKGHGTTSPLLCPGAGVQRCRN